MLTQYKVPVFNLRLKAFSSAAVLVLFFLCTGCGGDPARGSVTGKVTVDGEPLADGTILFQPTGDTRGPNAGATIQNGRYRIKRDRGATVGMNVVEITGTLKTGEPKSLPSQGVRLTPEMIYEATGVRPLEFESERPLEVKIAAGANKFDFPLRSIPPK